MSSSNPNDAPGSFDIFNNPYKAQRTWPPNFARMDPKNQFRLERKYRRRSKLAYARPRWTKGVKLAQFISVMGVLVYGVLFMDWRQPNGPQRNEPFGKIRRWVREKSSSIFSVTTTQPQRPNLGRISSQASTEQQQDARSKQR